MFFFCYCLIHCYKKTTLFYAPSHTYHFINCNSSKLTRDNRYVDSFMQKRVTPIKLNGATRKGAITANGCVVVMGVGGYLQIVAIEIIVVVLAR